MEFNLISRPLSIMEPTIADLKDLRRILASGTTPYVEALIRAEITKLEAKFPEEKPAPSKPAPPKVVYRAIDSYAFSDSNDFAKIIVREIKGLEQAQINLEARDHGFTITIDRSKDSLPNMKLTIEPLYKKILPADSNYRVKGETLTINLAKKKKTSWMKLKKGNFDTKKSKEESKAKAKEDPNNALMDMMKKMYDEGDDEMKRTIQKAMWEAQHKKPDEKE